MWSRGVCGETTSHLDRLKVWPRCRRPFMYGYGKVTMYLFLLSGGNTTASLHCMTSQRVLGQDAEPAAADATVASPPWVTSLRALV